MSFQQRMMVEDSTKLVQVPENIMLKTRMKTRKVRENPQVIQCKELCLRTYFLTFKMENQ